MTLDDRIAAARAGLHQHDLGAPVRVEAITSRLAARRRRRRFTSGVVILVVFALGGWLASAANRAPSTPRLDGRETPTVSGASPSIVEHQGLRGVVPDGWSVLTEGCAGAPRTVFVGRSDCAEPDAGAAWIWLRPVGELEDFVRECGPGYFGSSVAERQAGAPNGIAFCQVNRVLPSGSRREIRFIDGLDLAIVINHGGADVDGRAMSAVSESWTYDRQYQVDQPATTAIASMTAWLAADCDTLRRFADGSAADLCPSATSGDTIRSTAITGPAGAVPRTSFRVTLSSGAAYDLSLQYVFSTTTFRGHWLVAAIRPAS